MVSGGIQQAQQKHSKFGQANDRRGGGGGGQPFARSV